jgi:Transposase, Mutator family
MDARSVLHFRRLASSLVRKGGIIANRAVLIAIGVNWEGRRQVLAIDIANRESRSSWTDFGRNAGPRHARDGVRLFGRLHRAEESDNRSPRRRTSGSAAM